jgi:hypothetical protein
MSRRVRIASVVLAATVTTVTTLEAADEPYLALRTGLKCSQCHVNRTGGGGRNDFGSAWAQTQLPTKSLPYRSRSINDWISVGFDLRAKASGLVSDATPRTTVEINEAQVHIQASLIRNYLAFYLDQTVGPDRAFIREGFALVEGLPGNGYAKAGKFLLPFGLRVWDDDAFIRTVTGFTYKTPDIGFEIGFEPGPLSLALALSNGSTSGIDENSDKQVTGSAALVFPRFRLGASATRNSAPGAARSIFGGFAGVQLGPLGLLGEADAIFDSFDGQPDGEQFIGYVEGNLLLYRGVNLRVTYGYHDPSVDFGLRDEVMEVVEDQRIRMRFGLETFPVSFVQVSGFYTVVEDIPQVTTDRDQVSLEVHLHF